MEFKVNLLNEFLKIRAGYFTSVNTVIDEITQNAQRAGATEINVRFCNKYIQIEDNGIGCGSLDALLTKSQSGWSQEVMDSQNPAGEGFYSTALIADMVTFKSKIALQFNFGRLFSEKTLKVIENLEGQEISTGSIIKLENLIVDMEELMKSWTEHIEENLHYVPIKINIFNGDDLEYTYGNGLDSLIASSRNNLFGKIIDNDEYLFIFDASNPKTKIFYQSRLVTTIRDFFGGYMFVKGQAIDVRLPDRKDIVYNNKLDKVRYDIGQDLMKHIAKTIHYECFTETIKNCIDNQSTSTIFEIFQNTPIAYHFNSRKSLTMADFEQFRGEKIFYVDTLDSSSSLNLGEIAENNVYNGNQVIKIISPFRYVIRQQYNVEFFSAAMSTFKKKFDCKERYTTVDFLKYVDDFMVYLRNRNYTVPVYSIEVGTYHDENGNKVFEGLKKGIGDMMIHTECPVNLKGKKRCEKFILENLETFLHELSHVIFESDDETTHHFKSMVMLFTEWNNYINKIKE